MGIRLVYSSTTYFSGYKKYIKDWRGRKKAVPIKLFSIDNSVSAFCSGSYNLNYRIYSFESIQPIKSYSTNDPQVSFSNRTRSGKRIKLSSNSRKQTGEKPFFFFTLMKEVSFFLGKISGENFSWFGFKK